MKQLSFLVFFLFIILSVKGQEIIDNGKFFTNTEISELKDVMNQIKTKTTISMLVYTTMDLGGVGPKDYALDIAKKNHVGQKGVNNGIIILLSKNDKKIQILNGYGLEWQLSDSITHSIVEKTIPFFKEHKFHKGIKMVLTSIDSIVSKAEWIVIESTDKLSTTEVGKIIKLNYTNETGNIEFKHAIDSDSQFSSDFVIKISANNNSFKLYYSKYMNDLITKILTQSNITIYARLMDCNNNKMQLLGIE